MIQITDSEKKIYNLYLKYSRLGMGYRPRKDFNDLDENVLIYLKKISHFLNSYKHIDWDEYFRCYGELHPNEKYPNINFFTSRLAIKNYHLYKKQKELRDPEKQFQEIKDSMQFIGMFCIKNQIELENYIHHKTGCIYSWINHYREHKINPYALMEIGDVVKSIDSLQEDERKLFIENLDKNIIAFKTRYQNSEKTKNYTRELSVIIKNFIKKELTKK